MLKNTNNDKYIPGVCNIGPAERAKRRQAGFVGLFASLILMITLVAIGASRGWRLFLIIPLSTAALGFLQDWFHFCIGFGLKGLYNVIKNAGSTDSVSQAEYRAKDKKKAISILWLSLAIGVVIAILLFLV
jgi:fatty acid desaturase